MRITNNMLSSKTLENLNGAMERLSKLQAQITSGHIITTPSDDPVGAAAAIEFKTTIGQLEQYARNLDSASSWLDASDSAMASVSNVLHRARELAIQGANDSTSNVDKAAIANEVSQLIDQAVSVGNSTYAGQYVFSGSNVNTPPFALVGNPPTSYTYSGDAKEIRRLFNNQSGQADPTGLPPCIVVNTPGDATFGPILTSLIALRNALTGGSSSAVGATVTGLDQALDSVISARAQAGARMNRIADEKIRLDSLKTNVTGLLSQVQDVDMTEAITRFAQQQNVYQTALAAGAKVMQPSLLDYLK